MKETYCWISSKPTFSEQSDATDNCLTTTKHLSNVQLPFGNLTWLVGQSTMINGSILPILGGISTGSITTLHDTIDPNIWPRFKIQDTSVSSMLSFLTSRICLAIRSAIFLRMLASCGPGGMRGARCSMYMSDVSDSYGIQRGCFHNKKKLTHGKKQLNIKWIFQGP